MGVHAITVLAVVISQRSVSPFRHPFISRNLRYTKEKKVSVFHSAHCDGCNDFYNETASALKNDLPISIYISRRKFIGHATAKITGATSFTTLVSEVGAVDDKDSNSWRSSNNLNTISLPGPVPPFSTTRTYRNIVLSNGLKVVLVQDSLVQRSSVALSIDGAGQFSEPENLPGLAHLMEHIVLSSTRSRGKNIIEREAGILWNNWDTKKEIINSSGEEDFEDWLSVNDGESNAFTAPGFVCFHFNSPHEVRFESIFYVALFSVNNTSLLFPC